MQIVFFFYYIFVNCKKCSTNSTVYSHFSFFFHNQGCVITRDRDNFNMLSLDSKSINTKLWFLVQTNYDHWKTPPFFDDRRTPATKCLNEAGQKNASLGLIYNVLSTKPVLNKVRKF